MIRRRENLFGASDDHRTPAGVQPRQTVRNDGHIGPADLEKAMAAQRASTPALEVLPLLPNDRIEELIGPVEDSPVRAVRHRATATTAQRDNLLSLW
jgi:hypothetical protein